MALGRKRRPTRYVLWVQQHRLWWATGLRRGCQVALCIEGDALAFQKQGLRGAHLVLWVIQRKSGQSACT
jgi:hypothetical protein